MATMTTAPAVARPMVRALGTGVRFLGHLALALVSVALLGEAV